MKNIYFIRHGQTGGNTAKRHQNEDTHLTAFGKRQAIAVGKRVAELDPTHLIVSNRVRTLETGQAIAHTTNLIPETSELFVELCRPEYIYGYRHRSIKSMWYLFLWFIGRAGGDSCDNKGESYTAFRTRIKKAQIYLETLPDDTSVVVVSHSVFISLFILHMCHQKRLSFFRALLCFKNILSIKNGSITHVAYNKDNDTLCNWSLVSYNDATHQDT